MKGFGIYVKNNLLEPKHYQNMGEALWLYLWLLDKMTSVNEHGMGKVLSGKPITFEAVTEDLSVSRQVYMRWIKRLRDAGYINTLRTPKGLVFTVNKAEKIFGKRSIKNDTSSSVKTGKKGSIKNDTAPAKDVLKSKQQKQSDVSETIQPMYQNQYIPGIKNDTSNIDNTINNTVDNTLQDNAEALPAVRRGKPEINEIFDYWKETIGYEIGSNVQKNRYAASNLVKKHGLEDMKKLINAVRASHDDTYAPRIADFVQLQAKFPDLLLWVKKRMNASATEKSTTWRAKKK